MRNTSKMTLAQLIRTNMDPREKLRAAAQHSMRKRSSKRSLKHARARAELVDLNAHGRVLYMPSPNPRGKARFVATRWVGQDYLVTVATYLKPWYEWPEKSRDLNAFNAAVRHGTREACTHALRGLGIDFGFRERLMPWCPLVQPHLESMGLVRLVPERQRKLFEEDGLIHWGHHMRDGMYDAWAGCKHDKKGRPVWQGQNADDNNKEGFVPFAYNQLHSDGHGVTFVYRFKRASMEALGLGGRRLVDGQT